jgi:hypothetical protein
MASRIRDFRPQDSVKALLWCRRVCCLCGKKCGIGIELAHLDRNGPKTLDNAIPVCFDCHCAIGHYVDDHPRGKKYGVEELKRRRDQVYDEQTSPLVPPIDFRLSQQNPKRELPTVGFQIWHMGTTHPVRAYIRVRVRWGARKHVTPETVGHYDGRLGWNLNPGQCIVGWFGLQKSCKPVSNKPLRAQIEVTIADIYDYRYGLYPVGFVLEGNAQEWYAEPCEGLM